MRNQNSAKDQTAGVADRANAQPSPDDDQWFDWKSVLSVITELRYHLRLLGVVFAAALLCVCLILVLFSPVYTAIAIIGPPGPSPAGNMLASFSNTTGGSLANRVLGGSANGNSSDPYQDYLQLLPSSRLSQALIQRDHMLQTVFPDAWDSEHGGWRQPGAMGSMANAVKRLIKRPIKSGPGVDQLTEYLGRHLAVVRSTTGVSPVSLLPGTNSYMRVSFEYGDPKQAEAMLDMILAETDNLIREDRRHDVLARISFLKKALADQGVAADERTALTTILMGQEQLLAMLQADKRYASTLVIPPYASLTPTKPPGVMVLMAYAVALSVLTWIGLVMLSPRNRHVRRLVDRLKESRRTS